MKNIWRISILGSFIIIADQVTKAVVQGSFGLGESVHVIPGLLNFTYVRNPGAAFGFLATAPESVRRPLFLLIPVLACVWLLYLIWQTRNNNTLLCFAYGLIFSGAIGNLIDRFTLGYVVDFVDFHLGSSHFPAFNVADSAISIAAGLLIWDFVLEWRKKAQGQANDAAGPR